MILDNENGNKNVHEWIAEYTETGTLDIVTGYFTIGALAWLSEKTNEKIENYRFVLGDIVNVEDKIPALDLLNENIGIDDSLHLNKIAHEAVDFLQLDEVEVKTLEPNFCHAKLFLQKSKTDERYHYFISGSSNLTEAGIGQKTTSNVELNIAETGNGNQFTALVQWFDSLWTKPQAHKEKTLTDHTGKKIKKNFKEYLIEEISKLFHIYTPEQIYAKILFELFNEEDISPDLEKQFRRLEDTAIYNKLYDFQKSGVRSLIKMLEKYNGAILADAVGLGKTWSALAVMKSFQDKNYETILLCPKKLQQNWSQYQKKNNSLFKKDKLDYTIRFHTDLRDGGLERDGLNEDYFTDRRPKLFVIDESHNLRNDKSSRYQYLLKNVLEKAEGDVKVLLLSATPINNSFKDIRNQFLLTARGKKNGYSASLEVNNLESTFKIVQKNFNEWQKENNASLTDFHNKILDSDFFTLTDHLLVARTRKNIKTTFDKGLNFPKSIKPENIFQTTIQFGDIDNFAGLMENMRLNLSAYQPSSYTQSEKERIQKKYIKKEKGDVLKDEVQREYFLVKMMMILLLKRLESSWYAFDLTVQHILEHHNNALEKIKLYQGQKRNEIIDAEQDILSDEEEDEIILGKSKNNPVTIKDIDNAGNLEIFRNDILKDKKTLIFIKDCVDNFKAAFNKEKGLISVDQKLEKLLHIFADKQQKANKKILIFSAYKDSALYLFTQLKKRGLQNFAMIAGDENKVWDSNNSYKKHENILERFSPFTKLYKEKNWEEFKPSSMKLNEQEKYSEWKTWLKEKHPDKYNLLNNPIDVLIATDVLSEGQNLQDADLVINYDIHWNPVRVIQRVGRIDRIGSPNAEIKCINFWPAKDIDDYINLKSRVERRMSIMQFAGAEIIEHFTDEFQEIAQDQALEDRQNANMLRQMQASLEDMEGEKTVGFNDFSFDVYRQALQNILNQKKQEIENMPNGIFSGIQIKTDKDLKEGIIALLKNRNQKAETSRFDLVYIDLEGNLLSNNQKVLLDKLAVVHTQERYVPKELDAGEAKFINQYSTALKKWVEKSKASIVKESNGSKKMVAGAAAIDVIHKMRIAPKQAGADLKNEGSIEEKFQYNNFDLITWLVVSK